MKTRIQSFLTLGCMLFFLASCQQEETPTPAKGTVTFSLSQFIESKGKVTKTSAPAYVILSIKESSGMTSEHIRLSLSDSGQGYVSERLELQTGNHQLISFVVFDEKDYAIYTSPVEGSDLADHVTDPLPVDFRIEKENTFLAPQLLTVANEEQIQTVGLDIDLRYPAQIAFDSAYIVFRNDSSEIKYSLLLDNTSHRASGHVSSVPCGNWHVSTSYFHSIIANYKSLENTGVVELAISPTATHLVSTDDVVMIKSKTGDGEFKSFQWEEYYYYLLYSKSDIEGFARLPKDPTNPFVQVSTFEAKWTYFYTSRSFYNSSLDGSSNYHQGSCAFEIYGKHGETHDRLDRHLLDTTSLKPGILQLQNKTWNFVTGLIILYDDQSNELLLYYEWDLRTPGGG